MAILRCGSTRMAGIANDDAHIAPKEDGAHKERWNDDNGQ